jgi:hypothetical protein
MTISVVLIMNIPDLIRYTDRCLLGETEASKVKKHKECFSLGPDVRFQNSATAPKFCPEVGLKKFSKRSVRR